MIVGIEQLKLSKLDGNAVVPVVSSVLMEQVRRVGQVLPVVVREIANDQYEILANAESWIAVMKAGSREVRIAVLPDVDDAEAVSIIQAVKRRDPIDEAKQFREELSGQGRVIKRGDIAKLAVRTGVSRSYVAHSIRLLTLPESVQTALSAGLLKPGHGKALLGLKSMSGQCTVATTAILEKWSVRKTENAIRAKMSQLNRQTDAPQRQKSAEIRLLEKGLSEAIGSQVELLESAGKLTIDYGGDLDVLNGIIERIGYLERDLLDV